MISIVVGYRNREFERVKRSLDSLLQQKYVDFEMIFIDYGSDNSFSRDLEKLLAGYTFTKYCYCDTRGWLWNRAHALNAGAKIAKGDLLLFYDIDLILESNFLENLSSLEFNNSFYTFICFYLPEKFKFYNDILNKGVHYEQNYVGLCAIKKDIFFQIKGFDEYFMIWGVEDDDFYRRLELMNIKRIQLGQPKFYVFHQWHKSHSPSAPNAWYLEMVQYLFSNNSLIRNSESWGKIVEKKERYFYNHEIVFPDQNKIIIEFSSSLLIFNVFIQNFFNETINIGCVTIKILLLHNSSTNYVFFKNKSFENKAGFEVCYNFLTFFIAKNRHLLLDYDFSFTESELVFSYKKK